MTMGIKNSQSAIEQKESALHSYWVCALYSIYLNLAIGSSKYNFMIF